MQQTDAALWTINEDLVSYWLQMGPEPCRNQDGTYSKSRKQHRDKVKLNRTKRKLNDSAFFTVTPNGEKILRHWFLYLPSTGRLFYFVCKLFISSSASALANNSFDLWDHINRLADHERSSEHRLALTTYATRLSKIQTLDTHFVQQFENERSYWREVLRRVVSTVKFLASRGLALRGSTDVFGNPDNGNFLGYLEYLAEYDLWSWYNILLIFYNIRRIYRSDGWKSYENNYI